MNDRRADHETGDGADDGFEQALGSLLKTDARVMVPPMSLHGLTRQVIAAERAAGRSRRRGNGLRVLGSMAAAAAVITVGVITGGWYASRDDAGVAGGSGVSASQPPAIMWDTGSVRLEAESVRIEAGDRVFTISDDVEVKSAAGNPSSRTLEATWLLDDGLEMRLNLYLVREGDSWWVDEVRAYDGHPPSPEWMTYEGRLLDTPYGETAVTDLEVPLTGRVAGRLLIDDLRLAAFGPDRESHHLDGCTPAVGGPQGEYDTEGMTPSEMESRLGQLGICYIFTYEYPVSESAGYSELWCTAPPGVIFEAYVEGGTVHMYVSDAVRTIHPKREQPPFGWGCDAAVPGAPTTAP